MDFILSIGLENPGGKKQSKYSDMSVAYDYYFVAYFGGVKPTKNVPIFHSKNLYNFVFCFLKES